MHKEAAALLIIVLLVGFIGVLMNTDITGNFFKAPKLPPRTMRSPFSSSPPPSYRPPAQQTNIPPVQQPKINPDQWAQSYTNSFISGVQTIQVCKTNCFMGLQQNCLNNKIGTAGECTAIANKYGPICLQKCDAKFPQQAPRPAQTQPAPQPTQAQPPAQQQQKLPTPQECAANCENSAALLYKQCMDQGGTEEACQNVGKLQKESCTRKCFLGY